MNNAEKIAKLRKGLNNANIPDSIKEKIKTQIAALEKEDAAAGKQKPKAKKTTKAKTVRIKSAPSKPSKPAKESVFTVAKRIRDPKESWDSAKSRAQKMIKEQSTAKKNESQSELQSLLAIVQRRKRLRGIGAHTDILRDAHRTAMPAGKRISKDGNRYYESRENRSDRLAPKYENRAPYLEKGGAIPYQHVMVGVGKGGHWAVLMSPQPKSKLEKIKKQVAAPKGMTAEIKTVRQVLKHDKVVGLQYLDYGGNLAGHLGGGAYVPDPNLSGVTGKDYTGLVGETGALSSGELFEDGGDTDAVISASVTNYQNHYLNEGTGLHKGGDLSEHGLKQGDTILSTYKNQKIQRVREKTGDIVYVDLSTGARSDVPPAYTKGGSLKNERGHVNKDEDYEVRYAKDKPNRTGYKGKRDFSKNKTEKKLFGGFSSAKKADFVGKQYPTTDDKYVHILAYDPSKKQAQVMDMENRAGGAKWIDVETIVLPAGTKLSAGGTLEKQSKGQRNPMLAEATAMAKKNRKPNQTWPQALSDAYKEIKSRQ